MSLYGRAHQVRHQPAFQLREVTHHVDRLFVVRPGYAVRGAAVQPAVRRKQPKRYPTLVHRGRSLALEATDVVAPKAKATKRQRQTAAQGLGHGFVVAVAVTAPVHGKLLTRGRSRARKYGGFVRATRPFQELEHRPVV